MTQISLKQGERNIYEIMKTMCPPGYHHNGFVATHALGHKCMSCHKAIVVITGRAHCFHDFIYVHIMYIYIYIYIYIYKIYICICMCMYMHIYIITSTTQFHQQQNLQHTNHSLEGNSTPFIYQNR